MVITTECDQHKWATRSLGQMGKSALSSKKVDLVDLNSLSEGREITFRHCLEPYNDIGVDFHQLWDKTVSLVGWFHAICGQCIYNYAQSYKVEGYCHGTCIYTNSKCQIVIRMALLSCNMEEADGLCWITPWTSSMTKLLPSWELKGLSRWAFHAHGRHWATKQILVIKSLLLEKDFLTLLSIVGYAVSQSISRSESLSIHKNMGETGLCLAMNSTP